MLMQLYSPIASLSFFVNIRLFTGSYTMSRFLSSTSHRLVSSLLGPCAVMLTPVAGESGTSRRPCPWMHFDTDASFAYTLSTGKNWSPLFVTQSAVLSARHDDDNGACTVSKLSSHLFMSSACGAIHRTPRRVIRRSLQPLSNWIAVPESHRITCLGVSTFRRNGNAVTESTTDMLAQWQYCGASHARIRTVSVSVYEDLIDAGWSRTSELPHSRVYTYIHVHRPTATKLRCEFRTSPRKFATSMKARIMNTVHALLQKSGQSVPAKHLSIGDRSLQVYDVDH